MPDEQMNLDDLQQTVGEWADSVFTQATPESITTHLLREAQELKNAVIGTDDFGTTREEAADVMLLLMHLGHREGFSLLEQTLAKFEINKRRAWGKSDAEGVVEHVEQGQG